MEILMLDNQQVVVRGRGIADGNLVVQLGLVDIAWEVTSAKLRPQPQAAPLVVPTNRAGRRILGAFGIGPKPGHG